MFFVGRVRRILTIFLFVVHSQKIFGAIFEIDAIFLGLVGTRGVYSADNLPLQRQIFSLHYGQNYDGYYTVHFMV